MHNTPAAMLAHATQNGDAVRNMCTMHILQHSTDANVYAICAGRARGAKPVTLADRHRRRFSHLRLPRLPSLRLHRKRETHRRTSTGLRHQHHQTATCERSSRQQSRASASAGCCCLSAPALTLLWLLLLLLMLMAAGLLLLLLLPFC